MIAMPKQNITATNSQTTNITAQTSSEKQRRTRDKTRKQTSCVHKRVVDTNSAARGAREKSVPNLSVSGERIEAQRLWSTPGRNTDENEQRK